MLIYHTTNAVQTTPSRSINCLLYNINSTSCKLSIYPDVILTPIVSIYQSLIFKCFRISIQEVATTAARARHITGTSPMDVSLNIL